MEIEDFSYLNDAILKNGQYLVFSLSPNISANQGAFVGFRVVKQTVSTLYYDFVKEQNNYLPMAPRYVSPTGTSPNFQDKVQLSLAEIQNVSDMFMLTKANDALQVFYGISPSYVRVMLDYNQQYAFNMEQSINPSSTFFEVGIDGFQSPLNRPNRLTEFFVLGGINYRFTLMNTSSIPVFPSLNFVINRMSLKALTAEQTKKAITSGYPIKTLGPIDASIEFPSPTYPGSVVLPYGQVFA